MTANKTLFDKIWDAHEILCSDGGESLLWIDRHFVHEGSFHAFNKLNGRDLPLRHPELTFGVSDHYAPTHTRNTALLPEKRP